MKTIYFVAVVVLLAYYTNAKDCEVWSASSFDCGGHGKLEMQVTSDGGCKYGCKDGEDIQYCEDLYPAPKSKEYQHPTCDGKVATYDCGETTEPRWVEVDGKCYFNCRRSDMLFGCEQLHPTKAD